jgi:hypothetical protein
LYETLSPKTIWFHSPSKHEERTEPVLMREFGEALPKQQLREQQARARRSRSLREAAKLLKK